MPITASKVPKTTSLLLLVSLFLTCCLLFCNAATEKVAVATAAVDQQQLKASVGEAKVAEVKPRMITRGVPMRTEGLRIRKNTTESAKCNGCKMIVNILAIVLQENRTQEFIEEQVSKNICPLLPKTYQPVCEPMIRQMTPEIIQVIVERHTAQSVCQELLKWCE